MPAAIANTGVTIPKPQIFLKRRSSAVASSPIRGTQASWKSAFVTTSNLSRATARSRTTLPDWKMPLNWMPALEH